MLRILVLLSSLLTVQANAKTYQQVSAHSAIQTLRLDSSAQVYRCIPVELHASYALVTKANKPRAIQHAANSQHMLARSN